LSTSFYNELLCLWEFEIGSLNLTCFTLCLNRDARRINKTVERWMSLNKGTLTPDRGVTQLLSPPSKFLSHPDHKAELPRAKLKAASEQFAPERA
jgi:hypothetical protein